MIRPLPRIVLIASLCYLMAPIKSAACDSGTPPQLTPQTLALLWKNASGTCYQGGPACTSGDTVNFSFWGRDLSCVPHTFDWQFGDGAALTTSSAAVAHAYAAPGAYAVRVRISGPDTLQLDGSASLVLTGTVTVAAPVPSFNLTALLATVASLIAIALIRLGVRPAN